MNGNSRSKATGQTLMSQGEPMVWLTGGMFAIACTMICVLLSFLLYQGLATLWPCAYFIYALNSGEIIGGELQHVQTYTLDRQSIADFDAMSRSNAERLLGDRDQQKSTQLYLRTGNFDVSNRHFAFVPQVSLDSETAYQPPDIWLLERREWGIMYGFPSQLRSTYLPEFNDQYRQLELLRGQLDLLVPASTGESDESESAANSLEQLKSQMSEVLQRRSDELLSAEPLAQWSTSAADQIESHTAKAMQFARSNAAEIEMARSELAKADRLQSNSRLNVRKAELGDKTDLQSLAEEANQLASSKAIVNAQADETLASILAWEQEFKSNEDFRAWRVRLTEEVERQRNLGLKSLEEPEASIRSNIQSLPARSRLSIESTIANTLIATLSQYATNAKLAKLEEVKKSLVLSLQLPILEPIGDIAELSVLDDAAKTDNSIVRLFAADEDDAAKIKRRNATKLSNHSALLEYATGNNAPQYILAVGNADNQQTSIFKMTNKDVLISDIVRVSKPNSLGLMGKFQLYVARWFEFLFGQPREGGIEGGFFPALWGTIVMTLIMSVAVMPFGVIAALYMREYAKSGWVLSLIRISINNLAGVPSIVYGVFGLAFFCYTIGGFIDGGPAKAGFTPWPSGTWFAALAITAISGTCAFFLAALGSGSPAQMSKGRKRIASFSGFFWLLSLICMVALFAKSPFFHGFYEATLPNPTFGKGCLLWASCTLALLTLPVVIVATEEALSAVPNSLREGSYACGAGKWQTLQRIVLPFAKPGIITGFILAMARGAGEVAPMMLVGAIPLATDLPLDLEFPFFHGSRSFMHLGFQIYSLGFQSQNSEAAKPMVFTATLLLLTIVTLLNVTAIWLRARLRKRFQSSQF